MATGATVTTAIQILKEHYTGARLQNMVYLDNPLFERIPKDESVGGKYTAVAAVYGNPAGRSRLFSQAQTASQRTSTKYAEFLVTYVQDYSIATVSGQLIRATKSDENAFTRALVEEVDGAINKLVRSIAIKLPRDGWGVIGVIDTVVSASMTSTTLQLLTPNDAFNFEVGDELDACTGSISSSLLAEGSSGNGLLVIGVDRNLGKLSFNFNINDATNGIPSIAQGAFLSIKGDRQAGDNNVGASPPCLTGLAAWIPSSPPTSGSSFFGQDRSQDVIRLAGNYYDSTVAGGASLEEVIYEGLTRVAAQGGRPDHIFMSFSNFSALQKSMTTKLIFQDITVGSIFFRALEFQGPKGLALVFPDINISVHDIWLLQLNTWTLGTMGPAVSLFDDDGLEMIRQSSNDGIEVRVNFYGNLWCDAPGFNGRINL